MSIQILGGHGKIALLAARLLTADGRAVTSLVRSSHQIADIESAGATAQIFDLEHASEQDFAKQFNGAQVVVWSAGAGGNGGPQRTYAVDRDAAIRAIKGAEKAGVKHYITVSFLGSGPDHIFKGDSPLHDYGEAKAAADDALRKSSLNYTILGPGTLSDGSGSGRILLNPQAATLHETVSRANVALVLKDVIENPARTYRKTIDFLDGDEPIDKALASL